MINCRCCGYRKTGNNFSPGGVRLGAASRARMSDNMALMPGGWQLWVIFCYYLLALAVAPEIRNST